MNKNIHILKTDKPSRLAIQLDCKPKHNLQLSKTENDWTKNWEKQNIYITNDEKIKDGDWFLQTTYEGVFKCSDAKIEYIYFDGDSYEPLAYCKKIILTTDQDLIKDGVQAIDDDFLQWFVKNPSCKFVETHGIDFIDSEIGIIKNHRYKIIIPQEEPKQETCEFIKYVGCIKDICTCNTGHKQEDENYLDSFGVTKSEFETFRKFNKQGTLEEAAEKYKDYWLETKGLTLIDTFIAGAKWQTEKMYSEEEKDLLNKMFNLYWLENNPEHEDNLKEWELSKKLFEQFKKK
jgi:mannose/fructose/N-acetylgalactosamine-specific phosphotransferase system component IIB